MDYHSRIIYTYEEKFLLYRTSILRLCVGITHLAPPRKKEIRSHAYNFVSYSREKEIHISDTPLVYTHIPSSKFIQRNYRESESVIYIACQGRELSRYIQRVKKKNAYCHDLRGHFSLTRACKYTIYTFVSAREKKTSQARETVIKRVN